MLAVLAFVPVVMLKSLLFDISRSAYLTDFRAEEYLKLIPEYHSPACLIASSSVVNSSGGIRPARLNRLRRCASVELWVFVWPTVPFQQWVDFMGHRHGGIYTAG